MTSPRPWFDQGPSRGHYERGSIITTDDGTRWEILERLKQDDIQRVARSRISPSHATLKMSCIKTNANPSERSTTEAMLRVYLQIPHTGSEFEDSDTRAAQADDTFQPEELEAYAILSDHATVSKFTPKLLGSKVSKQGPSGFVPGGFLIVVVWERVQGLPIGDLTGMATGYWALPRNERAKIREHSESTFKEISSIVGIWPLPTSPHRLVWSPITETL
ncbi:unnamed protein product [Penicillium nalgiovense]|uniref:Uncharacterized protein n=1 Tax=Penicillium nalgiovense TaxID=60175 RepID=A0A9W4HDV2_PENNA|nr:unnamed protein product [Penicillium nalgiovense]CAG7950858.1 unnamed protein product [Penicillium nalgiovense]CAG7979548.1 unnamed protein product [Penicillium nalgiovense]CAG8002783.1 unnamed protein product [Penicillium nalgiovense]CAG8012134.1 unnamed protein product [Penicillium nalgiovense]